jgi:hypothetical protein
MPIGFNNGATILLTLINPKSKSIAGNKHGRVVKIEIEKVQASKPKQYRTNKTIITQIILTVHDKCGMETTCPDTNNY